MHLLAAQAPADHVPRRGLCLEHRALQVDVEDEIELVLGEVFRLFLAVGADAVHQDIDGAEMVRHFIGHAPRVGDGERVEGGGIRLVAEFADGRGDSVRLAAIAPGDGHFSAGRSQAAADALADSAVSSGDQRDFAIQAEEVFGKAHVTCLPSRRPRGSIGR